MRVYALLKEFDSYCCDDSPFYETNICGIVSNEQIADLWNAANDEHRVEVFEVDQFNMLEHLDRRTKSYKRVEAALKAMANETIPKI